MEGPIYKYHTVTPQLFPKPLKLKTSHNHPSYIIFLSVTYPYNLILINVYNIQEPIIVLVKCMIKIY